PRSQVRFLPGARQCSGAPQRRCTVCTGLPFRTRFTPQANANFRPAGRDAANPGRCGAAHPTTLSRMSSSPKPAETTAARDTTRAAAGRFTAVTAVSGALAAVTAAVVVGFSASQALSLLGIPDPGALTTYGLPAVRSLADLAAALTVGSLFFAAFLVPPQGNGLLDVGGYRAVRMASNFALVWACCAALL